MLPATSQAAMKSQNTQAIALSSLDSSLSCIINLFVRERLLAAEEGIENLSGIIALHCKTSLSACSRAENDSTTG